MAAGKIKRGEDTLILVEIEDAGKKVIRPFNQTSASISIDNDEIEIDTKDTTGSDYGKKTQTISLEGNITKGDKFPKAMVAAINAKEMVKIYVVEQDTMEAEYGMYMISSFERSFDNGEFATYSLDGTLNGDLCDTVLTNIPSGAPSQDGMDCEPETIIPVPDLED